MTSFLQIPNETHWESMKENVFISNRIFDALACGARTVSDFVPSLAEEFEGVVYTYPGGHKALKNVIFKALTEGNSLKGAREKIAKLST